MRRLAWACVAVLAVAGAGCAGAQFPPVVGPSQIAPAYGAPQIDRIRDAGSVRVPFAGAWQAESDGIASPGELLLVEGSDFGRAPTVTIGGRPTSVFARTEGGGLLVRVPGSVPTGDVAVTVAQPRGRASRKFPIRRFAVVAYEGKLQPLVVDHHTLRPFGPPLAVPGARRARIGGEGGTAYVLAEGPKGDRLVVIDLNAPHGPRVVTERTLAQHARLLTTAAHAPLAAAVGDGKLTLFSLHNPLVPAAYDPIELPKEARTARAIALSPDGTILAVLLGEGNRLVALDVSQPPSVVPISTVDLLPTEHRQLARDLAFSADGATLWVVSGDDARTQLQPTRLTAVKLLQPADAAPGAPRGPRLLSLWRTQSVPGAAAPLHLAIARGQPTASGMTVPIPPEKAAVFFTAINDALFKLGGLRLDTAAGARAALRLWRPPEPGMVVRADINGGGGPLFTTAQLLSAVDLTPDAQLLVALSARVSPAPGGMAVELGLTVAPVWGVAATPTFVPLGPLRPSLLKPPFDFGDVRIQP